MPDARKRTVVVAAVATPAALILVAATFAWAAPKATTPPAPTDATSLYQQAIATTRDWSVHYESSATSANATIVESGDAGPASGTQTVNLGKTRTALTDEASIIVIGGITYLKGNAAALSDLAGLSVNQATAAAGQWVDFATDNATFASVSAGVRSADVAKELGLSGPYSIRPTRTLDGTEVDAVEGSQTLGGKHIDVVLYVRARGKHVPVEEDSISATGRRTGLLHVVYSKWGEVVRPLAPQTVGSMGPVSST